MYLIKYIIINMHNNYYNDNSITIELTHRLFLIAYFNKYLNC